MVRASQTGRAIAQRRAGRQQTSGPSELKSRNLLPAADVAGTTHRPEKECRTGSAVDRHFIDVFSRLMPEELPELYRRMEQERLLAHVLGENDSLADFQAAARYFNFVALRAASGEIAGFWGLSFVGAGLWSFHFCLFQAWRSRAGELFQSIRAGLPDRLAGFSGLVFAVPRARRDLRQLLEGQGCRIIFQKNKELTLWVA